MYNIIRIYKKTTLKSMKTQGKATENVHEIQVNLLQTCLISQTIKLYYLTLIGKLKNM